jgi:hypothetical protein
MILDLHRLPAPATARILEATDPLLLLGIDANDRLSLTDKALALSGDMTELPGHAADHSLWRALCGCRAERCPMGPAGAVQYWD